jgi:hypothetical protein
MWKGERIAALFAARTPVILDGFPPLKKRMKSDMQRSFSRPATIIYAKVSTLVP